MRALLRTSNRGIIMRNDDEPIIISSPLSQRIEGDGTFIHVEIYRGQNDAGWAREVVDEEDDSTVYDEPFETDKAALAEVVASIQKYGIRVYLENGFLDDDVQSGTIHRRPCAGILVGLYQQKRRDTALVDKGYP